MTRRGGAILNLLALALLATSLTRCSGSGSVEARATQQPPSIDRTVLPIPEPKRPTYKELDARNAKAPARWEVKAPTGAPNVIVVLIDDIGFGASSAFGGPINMPTLEKVAKTGLKYNRFHTTALCSPTRVALLTGYNHHSNNRAHRGRQGASVDGRARAFRAGDSHASADRL